jgi:hypothetical protein
MELENSWLSENQTLISCFIVLMQRRTKLCMIAFGFFGEVFWSFLRRTKNYDFFRVCPNELFCNSHNFVIDSEGSYT